MDGAAAVFILVVVVVVWGAALPWGDADADEVVVVVVDVVEEACAAGCTPLISDDQSIMGWAAYGLLGIMTPLMFCNMRRSARCSYVRNDTGCRCRRLRYGKLVRLRIF